MQINVLGLKRFYRLCIIAAIICLCGGFDAMAMRTQGIDLNATTGVQPFFKKRIKEVVVNLNKDLSQAQHALVKNDNEAYSLCCESAREQLKKIVEFSVIFDWHPDLVAQMVGVINAYLFPGQCSGVEKLQKLVTATQMIKLLIGAADQSVVPVVDTVDSMDKLVAQYTLKYGQVDIQSPVGFDKSYFDTYKKVSDAYKKNYVLVDDYDKNKIIGDVALSEFDGYHLWLMEYVTPVLSFGAIRESDAFLKSVRERYKVLEIINIKKNLDRLKKDVLGIGNALVKKVETTCWRHDALFAQDDLVFTRLLTELYAKPKKSLPSRLSLHQFDVYNPKKILNAQVGNLLEPVSSGIDTVMYHGKKIHMMASDYDQRVDQWVDNFVATLKKAEENIEKYEAIYTAVRPFLGVLANPLLVSVVQKIIKNEHVAGFVPEKIQQVSSMLETLDRQAGLRAENVVDLIRLFDEPAKIILKTVLCMVRNQPEKYREYLGRLDTGMHTALQTIAWQIEKGYNGLEKVKNYVDTQKYKSYCNSIMREDEMVLLSYLATVNKEVMAQNEDSKFNFTPDYFGTCVTSLCQVDDLPKQVVYDLNDVVGCKSAYEQDCRVLKTPGHHKMLGAFIARMASNRFFDALEKKIFYYEDFYKTEKESCKLGCNFYNNRAQQDYKAILALKNRFEILRAKS